ncbi:MAG: IS630 family transposase [Planctomycetaceae bacterium]|nr:MAG: IS630 family transposase [Planctomycetaceae bacterium]
MLLASQGKKFVEVASLVGLSAKRVGCWVRRFAQSMDALLHVEQTQCKAKLTRQVLDCLRDAPRSGRPKQFTPTQVAGVISVACEAPEASGRPVTSWTVNEIVDESIKRGIVPSISKSQVQRFLACAQMRPHKVKGWCFTTEKDQELFQKQVEMVCQTYLDAPRLLAEKRVHTVCVDEMTSLQANEKRAPTKRPAPGQCGKEECQYTRHGTVCLTGNWDVVAGQFLLPTIEETRNNEDFAKHLERLIQTVLADGWVFVVDNLNTHCGEPLVRMVAKHLGIPASKLGEVKKRGILKDMASRRAFLSDTSHRIRLVYIPKHSSWLNQIEAVFGMINRRVMRGGSFTSRADLMEKLHRFVTYFNDKIAKPMKWTYTGRPTEKEAIEAPKTWRALWPFRRSTPLREQPDGT